MTDLDIIRQIEKELNTKLEELDKTEWYSIGYTLNPTGQVTGLGLYSCKTGNLNRIISPLSALSNLTQLDLSDNQVSDISPLSALGNLTQLDLDSNQVSDISPLSALGNLTQLDLRNNQVSDISPLSALGNLTQLDLDSNQVSDISPLSALGNLTQLYLSSNQVSDISPLSALSNLTRLVLSGNPIQELESWISDFNMEIQWKDSVLGKDGYITFYNNPLKTPPPEIIRQGREAVRNYFAQIKDQEDDYLFEAKMLIVGEAGAGKTSMAWKMEDQECALPQEDDTTRGIEVRQYYFPLQKQDFKGFRRPEKLENRNFRLNLWDFGGQEIYKATHRFFLSKRSLYVLVADSRNEDTDFNYWLHIVEMFGADSPLLIVLNEKYQRKRNLDISAMHQRFDISEVLDVDFAESDNTRLNKLERAVRYHVSQLPHIGSPVPARWTAVRESLEKEKRNFISLQDYLAICKHNKITKNKDALLLSQYFHDIGVFLHFQDDDLLEKTIFLKPNWATNAVYKILDHPLLSQKNGRFDKQDAKIIWNEDQYDFIKNELLKLMQKFFLTYEIEKSGTYIVPERLASDTPDYPWNKTDNLFLQYQYDYFMPKGILSQFIVQMHCYIFNHDYVWKRGVVLERENTRAEIIEAYDARSVRIRTEGKNKRDFMTIIAEQIDQINAQYEKMEWEKLIPCNCSECKKAEEPWFYKYKDLKRRIRKRRQEVECEISFEMVSVQSLIDDVISESPSHEETCDLKERISRQAKKRVFISYAKEDYDTAKKLYDDLKLKGTEPWLDRENLLAGQNLKHEIPRVIRESDYFLVLVSSNSVSKEGFVQKEQKIALDKLAELPENEIFIIPARTDSTKPLDETLQNIHWADLSSYEQGFKQILQGINS